MIDMTGMKYGRWTVIGYTHHVSNVHYWNCICQCGNIKAVCGKSLRNGRSNSCGCYGRDNAKGNKHGVIHGHCPRQKRTPTYNTWQAMINRCTNSSHHKYAYYGGRGIRVCKRWRVFSNFLDDMGERPIDKTIDRINPNKGYCPSNCRWATKVEQSLNQRKPSLRRCG